MRGENMILIMVDECGDEVEVGAFKVGDDLDEGYMELWKEQKIEEIEGEYPEAQRFYFEDRRNWNSHIATMLHDGAFYDPWEDEEVEV